MTCVVELRKEEPVVTSLTISAGVGITHKAVVQLIRQYETELSDFGTLAFEMRKSGGRPQTVYLLNEQQVYLLVLLMRNIGGVANFKKKVISEFFRMKKALIDIEIRQNSESWQLARQQGKLARHAETDAIKEFVEYCEAAGSKNAHRYYASLTNVPYKALFLLEQKFTNIRDLLTGQQLGVLSAADQIIEHALRDGVAAKMEYHAIFQMAKERVEIFASVLPKTPVVMLNEAKRLK